MDKKKKPNTYQMLKTLDKKVQGNSNTQKRDSYSRHSNDYKRRRSVSPKERKKSKYDELDELEILYEDNFDYSIPDRSHGDLYCKACDSHMNSENMWEAHIQGKRHLKNIKKGEEKEALKYDVSKEDPLFLKDIKDSKEIIIGLQHCCELQRPNSKPTYQCFMCSSNVPNAQQLIEHIVGLKHRMAYLKEHDPVKHELISKTDLKKGMIEPVVEECIQMHYKKYGHGKMQVKVERMKPAIPYYPKKSFNIEKKNERKKSPPRKPPQDPYYDTLEKDRYFNDRPYYEDHDFRLKRPIVFDYGNSHPKSDTYNDPTFDKPLWDKEYRDDLYRVRERSRTPPRHQGSSTQDNRAFTSYDQPSTSWSKPVEHQPSGDLRAILDQKKAQEANKTTSNVNVLESLMYILESLPAAVFLDLVYKRVEKMNPNEEELNLLQKIGYHIVNYVMEKKLKKLSPDLLNKFQETVATGEPVAKVVDQNNIPNSLQDLISYFKSSSTNSQQMLQPNYQFLQNVNTDPPSATDAAYVTQVTSSFFNTSRSDGVIPGLSVSTSNDNLIYNATSMLSNMTNSWEKNLRYQ